MERTIRIGGQAGQGIQLAGSLLSKYFVHHGFHVFTHQDYMSRIRGGHNFYQIRIADRPVTASRDKVDILLALDLPTIEIHRKDLNENGCILYDSESVQQEFTGPEFLNVPFAGLSRENEIHKKMQNTVALGAISGLLGIDLDLFGEIVTHFMHAKGDDIIAQNVTAAHAGFDYISQSFAGIASLRMSKTEERHQMLINGNHAIGLSALLSGCKFVSAYPMTPSTSIMIYMAGKANKYGVIVEQAEDEIAAINMALGASFGGVRAMTTTSGGGFALMAEGVSLAGMTETPIVIAEVQRPGPATGLPTRTEQSDLFFALHAGHGEFPRVVLTPGTPEQAFYLTNKAFHLSEKYQIPVIIQSDQYLADSEWTFPGFDTDLLQYEDFRLREKQLEEISSYQRYRLTEDGVSPLAIPGASKHLVVVDSDEHDEDGHIIEDAPTRTAMMGKRLFKKMPLIQEEIASPTYHGNEGAGLILVGYGSTYGVMKEIVECLAPEHSIGMLHFSEVYPFPLLEKLNYIDLLNQAAITLCVENNATGQFARLMRAETGFEFSAGINKYDGRPFVFDTLSGEVNDYLRRL